MLSLLYTVCLMIFHLGCAEVRFKESFISSERVVKEDYEVREAIEQVMFHFNVPNNKLDQYKKDYIKIMDTDQNTFVDESEYIQFLEGSYRKFNRNWPHEKFRTYNLDDDKHVSMGEFLYRLLVDYELNTNTTLPSITFLEKKTKMFLDADLDKDHQLTPEEFELIDYKYNYTSLVNGIFKEVFKYDFNKDKMIQLKEFASIFAPKPVHKLSMAIHIFGDCDRDFNQALDIDELMCYQTELFVREVQISQFKEAKKAVRKLRSEVVDFTDERWRYKICYSDTFLQILEYFGII